MKLRSTKKLRRAFLTPSLLLFLASAGIAQEELWKLEGQEELERFGEGLAGVGDVNLDGTPDLVIGASSHGASSEGRATVVLGQDGATWKTFDGDGPGHNFGLSADGAGDVDNDGAPDVLVGGDSNYARVFSGLTGGLLHDFVQGFPNWEFGNDVAGVGDVNNDGFADVMIGAWGDDELAVDMGSAFVFSGADGALLHRFRGANANDRFGSELAGGDVNGDGFSDLVIGGRSILGVGTVEVRSGLDGALLHTMTEAGTGFATAVAAVPDHDGDGWSDFLVGDPMFDSSRGLVTLYSGMDASVIATLTGEDTGDALGGLIRGGQDINGDGTLDFLVHVAGAGGSPSRLSATAFSGSTYRRLYHHFEAAPNSQYAAAFDVIGDVNGDGLSDLGVGAPREGNGTARVFAGNDLYLQPLSSTVQEGSATKVEVRGGQRFDRYMVFLTDLGGVPMFFLLEIRFFGPDGTALFSRTIPTGASGLSFTLVAFSSHAPGTVTSSNAVTIQVL